MKKKEKWISLLVVLAILISSGCSSKSKEANSKSKEKYRLKLIEKEKMLKDNNLDYYILFPSDLQEDFLMSIFKKD